MTTDTPRRMPPEQRREQLAEAAMEIAAQSGYAELSLDAVADRAGVTRNLLYHYFPRGKADVFLAAADRAGRGLTDGWVTDPDLPIADRLNANFQRMVEHAEKPSDAWLVYRLTRSAADPEARAVVDKYRGVMVESIALNHLGDGEIPPLVRAAIEAFLAFGENMLDLSRERGLDRDDTFTVMGETLLGTIQAAKRASES